MKLNRDDVIMLVCAIAIVLLGEYRDSHLAMFSGGAMLGGFLFKAGYEWSKNRE